MWYYALDGEQHGPVAEEDIQQLVQEGDLAPSDLVWCNGMEDWKPISAVDAIQPTPPPLPTDSSSPSTPSDRQSAPGGFSDDLDRDQNSDAPEPEPHENVEREDAGTTTYANFGRRAVAFGIDSLIVFAGSALLVVFIMFVSTGGSEGSMKPNEIEALSNALGFLVPWLYFAMNESAPAQATWGKQVMNLKVTGMNGRKIGFWKATGRHFGRIISGGLLLLGYIMAAFTEKHQSLHDIMAGCLVVEDS